MGIAESLIRVSVGIEDTQDLLRDFGEALSAA
jgi:O-acetylhomoserine (thiol)-lyase